MDHKLECTRVLETAKHDVCAFCGRHRELTDQHVLPRRLLKVFRPAGKPVKLAMRHGRGTRRDGRITLHDYPGGYVPKVRAVCGDPYGADGCNGGWMRDLEHRAAPLVTALGRGLSMPLSSQSQRELAFWAATVVATYELMIPNGVGAISAGQRRALYDARHALVLPQGFLVAMAQLVAPAGSGFYFMNRGMGEGEKAAHQQTTFSVGQLLFLVASWPSDMPPMPIALPDGFAPIPLQVKMTFPPHGLRIGWDHVLPMIDRYY